MRLGAAASTAAVKRLILTGDSLKWLREQSKPLPARYHVVTSLPDIGEFQNMHIAAYEDFVSSTVQLILDLLHPDSVAIFYQTDGRNSGSHDGSWLDKGFLCTLGARAAGAATVWHRIVNASRPAQIRSGRPGFARLICFSKRHRCGMAGVDVLPVRGHTSYAGAAGEAACSAAVQYIMRAHASRPAAGGEAVDDDVLGRRPGDAASLLPETSEEGAPAPALVLDPFCGQGTVAALANAFGLDTLGIDTNCGRCAIASAREPLPEEDVFDDGGKRIGPIAYWEEAS